MNCHLDVLWPRTGVDVHEDLALRSEGTERSRLRLCRGRWVLLLRQSSLGKRTSLGVSDSRPPTSPSGGYRSGEYL